jgi:hypothetical protein
MIYNAEKHFDVQKAEERFKWLVENKKQFELTQKSPLRSISQNNYLHLILGLFSLEYGETIEYVKLEMFKKAVNPDIFKTEYINKRTGEIREDWKSTTNLDSKEMTTAIDRFRDYSSKELGLYLPEPKDILYLNEINLQIENNKQYL